MRPDRSSSLCMKAVDGRYCTLRVGHEAVRFEERPCEHYAVFSRGVWLEACPRCGGPLGTITGEDSRRRLICGDCCRDHADAAIDAMFAEGRAEAERRRRAELRRTAKK